MANYISEITLPDNNSYQLKDKTVDKIYYGTCSTAAGTAQKDVTVANADFTNDNLIQGTILFVTFTATNSAAVANLTLKVGSADAKPLKRMYNASATENIPDKGYLLANQTYPFYYNGTNWVVWMQYNTNSTYSYMRPYETTGKGSYTSQNLNPVKTATGGWRYQLTAGKYFMYTHYYDNQAQSALTLNIGGTGAKPIYINGQPSSATNYTLPGGQYLVYYDGTNYHFRTDNKIPGNIAGDAATVNGLTVQTAVPQNALFTDKYHKTGSWNGLTYTATAVNSADELKFTIPNKIQTNWELNATSGNSPSLLFTRDGGLTDWKILVTSGKLSFQSATDASTWTERAFFADNSGNFTVTGTMTATNFYGDGANITLGTASAAVVTDANKKLTTRSITNNTSATAVTASTNLITANTLYYHKGNSNIVTVGTITSGTWNGTTIAIANGGTGVTTEEDIIARYGIEYIVGAQGTSANAWIGTTQSSALYIGKTIAYKLSHAPSGNASLTLTFTNPSGNANSGAIAVYTNNTRVTTHYAKNSVVMLVYDGTYWRATDYWNSNSRDPGYGKITPGATSTAVTALTANTTQITAGTYNEALTITPGNKWISLAGEQGASNGGDIFYIGHALSEVTAGTSSPNSAQTPSFNNNFNIPTITVDAAGHVTAMGTTTVKIPQAPVTSVATLTGEITASDLTTKLGLSKALRFIGKASTTISEDTTTAPTVTGVTSYVPVVGDVVLDSEGEYEYVCIAKSGTTYTWEKLGSSSSFALSDHTHGSITNDGKIGTTANRPIITSTGGSLAAASTMYMSNSNLGVNTTSITSPKLIYDLANTQSTLSTVFNINGGSYFTSTAVFASNMRAIEFRPGHTSYASYIYYGTSGNEALNFVNRQAVTSFIFWTGNSINSASQWYNQEDNETVRTDHPALQIKQNSVYINKLLPHNTNATYNLYVGGTSYLNGNSTINGLLTIAGTGSTHKGVKIGDTYVNAINGDIIFQNNSAIRFGTDAWDYNQWAGLKYVHSSKTIYLGIADKNYLTANSAQTNGTLHLVNTRYLYMNTKQVLDINLGIDNTAFKDNLLLFSNQSTESPTTGFDATKASWGIGFRRQWNTGNTGATHAGIYAFGVYGWKAGLVFRVKNGTTYTDLHDTTALILNCDGKATFVSTVTATKFIGSLEGNADSATYATSAGSVAWANTGHPDTFPPTIGTTNTTAMAGNTNVNNVSQGTTTTANWRKILLSGQDYAAYNTAVGNDQNTVTYRAVGVSVQPSTDSMWLGGNIITQGVGKTEGWIAYPNGGTYATNTATVTGALKITLPVLNKNTMMSFDVNIYTYDGDNATSCVYHISGYSYSNNGWHDPVCRVYSEGKGTYTNLKVRFGVDNNKPYVTIGETNTAWKYPQVAISNILLGYTNYTFANWGSGWSITFVTTLPSATTGNRENVNTQNINITGNAATATTASGVAWTNVSGRPTNLNQFTNGPGYVTSSGVTSITLKAGAGITLDTDNTAITSTGTRTISISGINTSSGSETTCLTAKGTWKTFGTSNLTIGSTSDTAMAGNTTVTNVSISADTTTNKNYAIVFGTTPNDGTSPTAAKTEGLQKNSARLYFNPNTVTLSLYNGTTTGTLSATNYSGNAATATAIQTAGTTAQFYRGDNSWSNTLVGPLYINDSTDVAGNGDTGALIVGTKTSTNIAIDDNEIMARNNKATSTLYLNNDGGLVSIGSGGISTSGKITSTLVGVAAQFGNNSVLTVTDNATATSRIVNINGKLCLNRSTSSAYGRISFYAPSFYTWFDYMSDVTNGAAPTGGKPSSLGDVTTWARRTLIENQSGYGWIWEAASNAAASANTTQPTARMALSSNTGKLRIAPNASNTDNESAGLIIDSAKNGSSGNVAIELWRGNNASWQIANESGTLYFRNNYTTAKQTTYTQTSVSIAYNTGNATFAGSVTATGGFSGSLTGTASKATAANLTTTANAIAYYTDTAGTFSSKASANGALYATETNGTLQWGKLPIAQGGTGATSFTKDCIIVSDGASTPALVSRGLTVSGATNAAVTVSVYNTNSGLTIKPNGSGTMTLSTAGGALTISTTSGNMSLSSGGTVSITSGTSKSLSISSGSTVSISSTTTMSITSTTSTALSATTTMSISGTQGTTINSGNGYATVFKINNTEYGRFNTSGMFQLNDTGTQNTHKLYVNGDSAFNGKIAIGEQVSNVITEKVYMKWNATDLSLDFIFA